MRMIKRGDMTPVKATIIRVNALILALLTASAFIGFMGHNPIDVFVSMFNGAFGNAHRIKDTLTISIPLIVTSIGIMIAFKMKFWNIGAEGQILMGAWLASVVGLNMDFLPGPVLITLMVIAGFIGGGLWAAIPAVLKVKFGSNETIMTLMLNYVAIKFITFLQHGPMKDPKAMGFPKIATFSKNAILPKVFGVHMGWMIAVVIVLVVAFLLAKTKKGFEISVVGESLDTARYSGMNVKRIIVSAVIVSGGICGIVGMMEASGVNLTLSTAISAGYGYTAIITTWLSGLRAIIIVPVSILFAGMIKGGGFIQTAFMIPQSAADVLQALLLFFIIGSEFFINYKLVRRNQRSEVAK